MLISDLHDLTEAVQWCEVCKQHETGKCDGCHVPFSAGEQIYRSQTFHYHPASIGGVAGVRSVQKELCVECYRADHALAYPNNAVPDLPDRGVDPNYHAAQRTERRRKRIGEILTKASTAALLPEEASELNEIAKIGLRFC